MSGPSNRDPARQHTMEDWLDLHALDRQACVHLLEAVARDAPVLTRVRKTAHVRYEPLDPEGASALATLALRKLLPQQHQFVDDTFQGSEMIAIVGKRKSRRALTIDHGPAKYPTILYHFHGDASDPLVIAHEFGHALQIRASDGKFVAPVMREVCAFVAEGALLAHCKEHDPPRYAAIRTRWNADSRKYLNMFGAKLAAALTDRYAPYEYSWNYPVARYLAQGISQSFSPDAVWPLFQGDLSVSDLMHRLESVKPRIKQRKQTTNSPALFHTE